MFGLCSDQRSTHSSSTVFGLCQDSWHTVLRPCLDWVWTVLVRSSKRDLSGSQWISFFTLSTLWLIYPIPKTAWDPCSDHFGTLFGLSSDHVMTPDRPKIHSFLLRLCSDHARTLSRLLTYSVQTMLRLCSDSLLKWISVDLSGSHFLPWAHLGHIILYLT